MTQLPENVHRVVYDEVEADGYTVEYCVFVIEADGVLTLFDAGWADPADQLHAELERLDLVPERLVITHGDGDHVGGFDAVVDRFTPETYVPTETVLEAEHTPDNRYADGDIIGGFEAVHVPGHEADHYVLVDESIETAVLGDAVWGSDRRGLPSGYFVLPPAVYSEDLNEAETSLERVLEYEFEVGLVFHGSPVTRNARTILDTYVNFPGR